ncbi:NAD(P)H-quinone oxidoreductase [Fulvivirga sediminis]|uniref:NAD(P)H-quinone oxidoreductase n=1 Tax=Fulvivirga sediminis TaxID=2803949 RepID=A0A937F8S6_9BACT|nr:NAD(P)H-quinone oxidoreductase [Fulvivirga sediminis]MBL3657112.1 NAD(P)H-quinone oxidoreductase [Fulvivirga sediminis]
MKVIAITQPGEAEVLKVNERPTPGIAASEVLINVKAAGVNRPDVMQRQGKYPAPDGAPEDIPGLEVAGVVEESNHDRWKIGDKVCALLAGGGYAEYVAVSGDQCLPIPEGLSYIEAAALPETFFTVWTNIFDLGQFKAGDKVLIHGGTSGIGVAAIQMVTALGGTVFTTVGNEDKQAMAEKLGAEKAINYKTHDFEEEIKTLTSKQGVNIILDMIGGEYTSKNINILSTDGKLIIINAMNGRMGEVDLLKVMSRRLTITGSTLRPRDSQFKGKIRAHLEEKVWPLLDNKTISPIIYDEFPLEQAADAHKLMESSKHIGKIILTL